MAGIGLEQSKESHCSTWGLSLRLSTSKLLPRQGTHMGRPAPGVMSPFTEPHEELIRWKSGDKHRH